MSLKESLKVDLHASLKINIMPTQKISEMTEADLPLDGTEDIEIVQAGVTRRCSTQDVANLTKDGEPRIYKALVYFNGSAFTIFQLKNTLGDGTGAGAGDVVWSDLGGAIQAELITGTPFVAAKLFIPGTTFNAVGTPYLVTPRRVSDTQLNYDFFKLDGTHVSTPVLLFLPIEIKVYS